jgi:hypothetical protein
VRAHGLGVLAVVVITTIVLATRDAHRVGRAIIPAYLPPSELEQLAKHDGAGSLLIVNPDSGPGARADSAYAHAIAAARAAKWRVLGYVATGYGTRDRGTVEDEIARYADWYDIDGIFLDETSHAAERLPYFRELRKRIPGLVVINPGVVPDRGYLSTADVIVTYEGPYRGRVAAPAWLPADRAAQLVYAAPRRAALSLVSRHRAGFLYVTSRALPNPWSSLPRYLDAELHALTG